MSEAAGWIILLLLVIGAGTMAYLLRRTRHAEIEAARERANGRGYGMEQTRGARQQALDRARRMTDDELLEAVTKTKRGQS